MRRSFPYTLHLDELSGAYAWNCDPHVREAAADVLLLSGCEDDECSADASCRYGQPAGAMTSAFLDAMALVGPPTSSPTSYPSLLSTLLATLAHRGFEQRPQISSTHPFALTRTVALDDALPPGAALGPVVRVPRPPCAPREIGGGLGEMLSSLEATGFLAGALAAHAAHGAHGAHGTPAHEPPAPSAPSDGSSWSFASFFGMGGGGGGEGGGRGRAFDAEADEPPSTASFEAEFAADAEDEGGYYDEGDDDLDGFDDDFDD
jgi:hypothetical protein